jgi:glycosyltransferase 2 family protein
VSSPLLKRRSVRVWGSVLLSALVLAALLWQIDLDAAIDAVARANGLWLMAALTVSLLGTWGMAWRWQLLLAPRGLREPLGWLVRAYFAGYAAGQVLPTGLGGDALRIVEHARRRPGRVSDVSAAVVLERAIGLAGILVMAAIGLALAVGRYEGLRAIVVVEVAFVAIGGALFFLVFSRRARPLLRRMRPVLRWLRIERPLSSLYEALHAYRDHPQVLMAALGATVLLQLVRTVPIWFCGEAVGLDLSPLAYIILAPLLSLALLVPFTLNGFGVREAFFVTFLAGFGVSAEAAFAAGFLYFTVTVATALPGAGILLWRSTRQAASRDERHSAV